MQFLRAGCKIEEERLLGVAVAVVVHVVDRAVDDVGREVIVRVVGLLDPVVVLDQVGLPLVRHAVGGAVVAVEAALERPFHTLPSEQLGKALRTRDAIGRYVEACKSSVPKGFDLRGLPLVVDCANANDGVRATASATRAKERVVKGPDRR